MRKKTNSLHLFPISENYQHLTQGCQIFPQMDSNWPELGQKLDFGAPHQNKLKSSKVPDLSHLGPIWPKFGVKSRHLWFNIHPRPSTGEQPEVRPRYHHDDQDGEMDVVTCVSRAGTGLTGGDHLIGDRSMVVCNREMSLTSSNVGNTLAWHAGKLPFEFQKFAKNVIRNVPKFVFFGVILLKEKTRFLAKFFEKVKILTIV